MSYWAAVLIVVTLLAAVFSFGGVATESANLAKILFLGFAELSVLSLILGPPRGPEHPA
jgi:uncharacterized membrane protein YtjA (UPF0391 family)